MRRSRWGARRGYRRALKKMRYSAECALLRAKLTTAAPVVHIPIAPKEALSSAVYGMRKAKNFTLTLASALISESSGAVGFALVYWPEVYTGAPTTFVPTLAPSPEPGNAVSLYEPNQNVVMQGIWSLNESSYRGFTRLSRNLNSGDTLMLVLRYYGEGDFEVLATVKFAIGYG